MTLSKKMYFAYSFWVVFALFYFGKPWWVQSWKEPDLWLMMFSYLGLNLYVFNKAFIHKIFWKSFWVVLLLHDFYWHLGVDSVFEKSWPHMEVWLWMISFMPLYCALFHYAFEADESS